MAEWALGFLHISDDADDRAEGGWNWLSFNAKVEDAPDNSGSWGNAVSDLCADGWEYVESTRYQTGDDTYGTRYASKRQLHAD
jgi:hypothetical protein